MKCRLVVHIGKFVFANLLLLGLASPSPAQIATLTDQNSVIQVNMGAQAGMFNWSVDGVNQLSQQQFWYRLGPAGPEASVNTLSAPTFSTPNAATLFYTYNNGSLSTEIDYVLTGGTVGSHQSGLGISITLSNATASPMDMHFFQYADFDLNGVTGGQSVTLSKNISGLFNDAFQTGGGSSVSETSVVPGATHGEANLFNATLVKLNDANPTTLNDAATAGPGDVTWALEWDVSIPAGGTKLISKTLSIIPEPGTAALISLGLVTFGLWKRNRRSA